MTWTFAIFHNINPLLRDIARGLLIVAFLLSCASAADRSVALVIGNSSYGQKPLANPGRDARLVAAVLRDDLGFDVVLAEDVDRVRMLELIERFRDRARGADSAVFYYSGHGMQDSSKRNYLIPIDARIGSELALRGWGVQADDVVAALADGPRVSLIILDACRDSPFGLGTKSGSKGLGRMDVATDNELLIAFATRDGEIALDGFGANSPYATALAQQLRNARRQPLLALFDNVADEVRTVTRKSQRPTRYGDLKASTFLVANNRFEPVPVGRGADFGDLERSRSNEETRQKWAAWQQRMQTDFDKAAGFSGTKDLEVKAWERFLAAYKEDNPYTGDDERLRSEAERRRGLQGTEKYTLSGTLLFDFDKAVIRPDGRRMLDEMISRVSNAGELEVVIAVGHTDHLEGTSSGYRQKFSEKRAQAVKDYLVSKGFEPNRIYTEGKGAQQPVTDGQCEKSGTETSRKTELTRCLAPNRRAEVEVIGRSKPR